jgi:AcrR family transcriptional regulator
MNMLAFMDEQDSAGGTPGVRAARSRSRYRSALRNEQAAQTRRRIATAALELFAEHGFGGTTVAAIAARAGVSAPTVYAAFGSKGAIVRALLTRMEEDADAAKWRTRIAAEVDPYRKLEAFAEWSGAFFAGSKAVIAAARGAAADPAIVELRDEGDRHRRQALQALVSALAAAGALAPGITEQEAVDRAWILTGVETYLSATEGCGWSDAEYARWLADLLHVQLLGRSVPR